MDKVNLLLAEARLPPEAEKLYAEKFALHGYDDIQFVLGLTPSGLETLKQETGMVTGHFARLQQAIFNWRKRLYDPTSTANTAQTPLNVSSGRVVNNSVGGPNAVVTPDSSESSTSAGAQPVPSGPVPLTDESTATTVPATAVAEEPEEEVPEYFLKSYETWKLARLVSLNHSTALGCSVCSDNKRSGGRYKVLICRTVGCKKRRRQELEDGSTDLGPKCDHKLVWSKNKLGHWRLKLEESNIAHKTFCSSGQRVTSFELVHDPEFVAHINTSKDDLTGKKAALKALGGRVGRIAGSVKDFTARRARNEIKNWSHKDYAADFCKMRQWGREYERKNPGGRFRFHLEPGTNRLGPGYMLGPGRYRMHVACWARTDTECVLHVGPMQVPKMFHKRPGHHQYCPRCRHEVQCS